MLAAGEVIAAIGATEALPKIAPLIPDADEVAFEALRQRGLYPINHLVVVKDELLQKHPGLAPALFEAFAEAKRVYIERLRTGAIAVPTSTDLMYGRVMEITDADPLPYGIGPNRSMIEELVGHAVRQQIIDRPPAAEDLFPESTHRVRG
jgi:4,5-dihydroxyphthalate decarboxylase